MLNATIPRLSSCDVPTRVPPLTLPSCCRPVGSFSLPPFRPVAQITPLNFCPLTFKKNVDIVCTVNETSLLKLINYSCSSYPTRASYSGQVDGCRNPMKNALKTRPCLKRFQTRMQFFLKCHYDENRIFFIKAILKHKQVACMRKKMLFTFFKYLFLFQRHSSF